MTEGDPVRKNSQEQVDSPVITFLVNKDDVAIAVMLAMKMSKTGKGNFVVKQPEDADIDPKTGYLYEGKNEGKIRLLREGQNDYRAYDFALDKVLNVKKHFTGFLKGEEADFWTGMAIVDEMQKQVDYFHYDIGEYKDYLTPVK